MRFTPRLRLATTLFLLTTTAVAAGGCAVDELDLDAVDQDVSTAYWWDQYRGQDIRMMRAIDGFCFLTEVTGHFVGLGETVHLEVRSDGYWWLGGTSQQDGVGAEARCVPYADYQTTTGSAAVHPHTGAVLDGWGENSLESYQSACYLSGIAGQLNGGGEAAWLVPHDGIWWLDVRSGATTAANGLDAGAACVDFGQVGDIHYWGGTWASFGEHTWSQGQAPVRMAPVADADCALTRVTGRFAGGGEHVAIREHSGWWYLEGASQQVDVGASARCFDHVQPIEALVRDGSFESQRTTTLSWPWSGEGTGSKWIVTGWSYVHSGNNGAYVSGTSGWNALTNVVAVEPYHTYTARAFMRTWNVPYSGYFGVRDPNGTILKETRFGVDGAFLSSSVTFDSGPNTWVRVYAGFWAPGTYAAMALDDVTMTRSYASSMPIGSIAW